MTRHIMLTVVAATMLVAPAAVGGSALAKVPGPNGRILFVRDTRNCEGCHLTTINPDGTHPDRIPDGSGAGWSPDGSQIASAWVAPDGRLTTAVMDADGSNQTVFDLPDPTLNLVCIVWSADGTRLLCEGWDDERPHRAAGMFSVSATDGQDLIRLTSNPYGGHDIPNDTSPDGTQIVFTRENPQRTHRPLGTVVSDSDGSNATRIGPWISHIGASWSPDGSRILTASKGSLWTMAPDGGGRTEVPLHAGGGFSYAVDGDWSPGGDRIVFSLYKSAANEFDLYTVGADGGQIVQVTNTRPGEFAPDWGTAPLAT